MRELNVVKSNHLIEASYKLSLNAQKLILTCLAKIDSRTVIDSSITITSHEFSDLAGINQLSARRDLYRAVDDLFSSSIVFNSKEEGAQIVLFCP